MRETHSQLIETRDLVCTTHGHK